MAYPKWSSIFDAIDPKLCSVKYALFDSAVAMVKKAGRGALLENVTFSSSFWLLLVYPMDFELLCFTFKGACYYDQATPFVV